MTLHCIWISPALTRVDVPNSWCAVDSCNGRGCCVRCCRCCWGRPVDDKSGQSVASFMKAGYIKSKIWIDRLPGLSCLLWFSFPRHQLLWLRRCSFPLTIFLVREAPLFLRAGRRDGHVGVPAKCHHYYHYHYRDSHVGVPAHCGRRERGRCCRHSEKQKSGQPGPEGGDNHFIEKLD